MGAPPADEWSDELLAIRRASLVKGAEQAGIRSPEEIEAAAIARLAAEGGLIGERTWYDDFTTDLAASLAWAVRRLGLRRAVHEYPVSTAVHLVLVANRHYEDRDVWSAVGWVHNAAEAVVAGQAFERALTLRGLERFRGLRAEGAHRYVAPILAHGGIPIKLLDRFFRRLLLPALARGEGSSAEELIGRWRASDPAGIGRPVLRFLRYGGAPAVDFVARCIELTELERAALAADPAIAGLPSGVVAAFLAVPEAEIVPPSRAARPAITIDPWDNVGPEIRLPAVGRERAAGLTWEIVDGSGVREIAGSAHTERVIPLAPAEHWLISAREPGKNRRFVYEATGANGIISFDADTFAYVRDERGIRADHLWILAGREIEIGTLEADEEFHPRAAAEEGATLARTWSSYRLARFDLAGVDLLGVQRAGAIIARIPVSRVGESAELVGQPVRDVVSVDGLPVYPVLPGLSLPAWGAWQVSLAGSGRTFSFREDVTGARRTVDLGARWGSVALGSFELVARGLLGRDLRTAFAVVSGLRAETPDAVVAPDAGAIDVSIQVDPEIRLPGQPFVRIGPESIADEIWVWHEREAKLGLIISIPRLRFAIRFADDPRPALGAEVVALLPDDMGTAARSVVVATGRRGASVKAALEAPDGALIAETPQRHAGPDGTVSLDLARLRDAARAATFGYSLIAATGTVRAVVARHVIQNVAQRAAGLPALGASTQAEIRSISAGAIGVVGHGWNGLIQADRLPEPPSAYRIGDQITGWVIRNNDSRQVRLDARPFDPAAFPLGRSVEGLVTSVDADGLWLDVDGVRAKAPVERLPQEPSAYKKGERIHGTVVGCNPTTRMLRVSFRPFVPGGLARGAAATGQVIRAASRGLLIDLGSAVGIGHVRASQMGGRSAQSYATGERIEATVIGVDRGREQYELSLRDWEPGVSQGDVVEGTVERVNGLILVRLPSGVRGAISGAARVAEAGQRLRVGDSVRVRVQWINAQERKIGLTPDGPGVPISFGDAIEPESPFAVLRGVRPDRPPSTH